MIYSVANPDYTYRYFTVPGTFSPSGHFTAPRGRPINGLYPRNQYLPLLPAGAAEVGRGENPAGVLAVFPVGLMEGIPEPVKRWVPPITFGLLVGWFGRKFFSSRKRK